MRGIDHQQSDMFSYLSPEQRVRKDHPLRAVRAMTDEILNSMSPLFDALYAEGGRPSIPPEKLLRAQLLQMLYSVRSERLLMEEIDYSILFRWFVGLNLDEDVWDATTFTKNRDRLLERAVAKELLAQVAGDRRITVAGDKGFDTVEFVAECRHMNVTPHVAQNTARPGGSAIDSRTTRHPSYATSQKRRKRIEECFGWLKDIALLRKLKHRGLFKVGWIFTFAAAAYNLVRLRNLISIQAAA